MQVVDPGWRTRAACRGLPVALFYPTNTFIRRRARAVCAVCAVQPECLEYALHLNERFGVWAGTTDKQRRRLRVQRGITSRAPVQPADLNTL